MKSEYSEFGVYVVLFVSALFVNKVKKPTPVNICV